MWKHTEIAVINSNMDVLKQKMKQLLEAGTSGLIVTWMY